MILLVCGGREYSMRPYDWLRLDALHLPVKMPGRPHDAAEAGVSVAELDRQWRCPAPVLALYEGEANGADICGRAWAESRGVPVRPFPADWTAGRSAGPARNARMLAAALAEATQADELVVAAFPGGTGTANMIGLAREAGVRVLDYREPFVQRWTADDIRAVEQHAEYAGSGGEPEKLAWSSAIMRRWAERGCSGIPLCSAHLWTDHGRVLLPPAGALYIGRRCAGLDASLLANPFRKDPDADVAVLLGRYRDHLRALYKSNTGARAALHAIRPWTLLVCWCHASKPCHGTVVADAAMQSQAAAEIKAGGRELPAPHWSAYHSSSPAPPSLRPIQP